MRLRALLLIFGIAAGFALPVHAQYSTTEEPVSLVMSPTYPKPYETVTVLPKSSLINLGSSQVSITVNGVVVQKGSGAQGASFAVGGAGETTKVMLSVKASDGQTYTSTLLVHPADVALVVEPVSTVHPFYKGLPLLAPEARVRLVAVPDLRSSSKTALDPSTLVYTWKLGDQVLESASGIGRSVLVASAPLRYRDADITLTVTSPDQAFVAQAQTTLSPADPVVRIYADDPLKGPDFDNALSGIYTLPSAESTFRAVAYFFSTTPTLTWSVGNKAQGAQRTLTVRSTGNGSGNTPLDLSASIAGASQSADTRITLSFGKSTSPLSIFGF